MEKEARQEMDNANTQFLRGNETNNERKKRQSKNKLNMQRARYNCSEL